MKNFQNLALAILLSPLAYPLAANATCGGEFCSLNTDWDIQGVTNKAGLRLDVRAEYINLDQLRHGSRKVEPAGELDEHDELRTINRNYLATLDWNINPNWGVSLKLPLIDRAHKHVHNEDDGAGGVEPEIENGIFLALAIHKRLRAIDFMLTVNKMRAYVLACNYPLAASTKIMVKVKSPSVPCSLAQAVWIPC